VPTVTPTGSLIGLSQTINIYAVVMKRSDGTEILYRVFTNRSDAESYLRTCQQAAGKENFRFMEVSFPRDFTNDDRITVK
jgi:hypothetical protein